MRQCPRHGGGCSTVVHVLETSALFSPITFHSANPRLTEHQELDSHSCLHTGGLMDENQALRAEVLRMLKYTTSKYVAKNVTQQSTCTLLCIVVGTSMYKVVASVFQSRY